MKTALLLFVLAGAAQAGEWAKIDKLGFVVKVIVADKAFIDTLPDKDAWVETKKGGKPKVGPAWTWDGKNFKLPASYEVKTSTGGK
jgi:hypothetical protein